MNDLIKIVIILLVAIIIVASVWRLGIYLDIKDREEGDTLCRTKGYNKMTDKEYLGIAVGKRVKCDGHIFEVRYGKKECGLNEWARSNCTWWQLEPIILVEVNETNK